MAAMTSFHAEKIAVLPVGDFHLICKLAASAGKKCTVVMYRYSDLQKLKKTRWKCK